MALRSGDQIPQECTPVDNVPLVLNNESTPLNFRYTQSQHKSKIPRTQRTISGEYSPSVPVLFKCNNNFGAQYSPFQLRLKQDELDPGTIIWPPDTIRRCSGITVNIIIDHHKWWPYRFVREQYIDIRERKSYILGCFNFHVATNKWYWVPSDSAIPPIIVQLDSGPLTITGTTDGGINASSSKEGNQILLGPHNIDQLGEGPTYFEGSQTFTEFWERDQGDDWESVSDLWTETYSAKITVSWSGYR